MFPPAVTAQFSGCAICAMMGSRTTSVFPKKKNIYSAGGTIPVLDIIFLITFLSFDQPSRVCRVINCIGLGSSCL